MNNHNDRALSGLFALLASIAVFHGIAQRIPQLVAIGAVYPRQWQHLHGIATYSFLHLSNSHLHNNAIGLFTLGTLVILVSPMHWHIITFWSSLLSGIAIFIFGSADTFTVGASGIVYGYFGYLLAVGIIHRRLPVVMLSITVALLHDGHFAGIHPQVVHDGISWLGHIGGFMCGSFLGFFTRPLRQGSFTRKDAGKAVTNPYQI